jgi:hypothetical protein
MLATNWQAGVSGLPLSAALSFDQAMQAVGLSSTNVPEPGGIGLAIAAGGAIHGTARRRRS